MKPPVHGDVTRQAVESLGGYAYQIYAASLAWAKLKSGQLLHLEIAEDFAISTKKALNAVQVKRTGEKVTSNTPAVAQLIDTLVDLQSVNVERIVQVRLLTTSEIGLEKAKAERVAGKAFLDAWAQLRRSGDVGPLRARLSSMTLKAETQDYLSALCDEQFRTDVLQRVWFDCGSQTYESLQAQLDDVLVEYGAPLGFFAADSEKARPAIIEQILNKSIEPGARQLSPAEFRRCFEQTNTRTVSNSIRANEAASTVGFDLGTRSLVPIGERKGFEDEAPRSELLANLRRQFERGLLWLHAGTGYGKTHLARTLVHELAGSGGMVLLRNLDPVRTNEQLRRATVELASRDTSALIVDDLDYWQTREVSDALRVLLDRARSMDVVVAITTYVKPSNACLTAIGASAVCCREVPDLTEDDIEVMISSAPPTHREPWAQYVRLASRGGHPQLAHALIQGLKSRNWPADDLAKMSAILGSDEALNATKDDIRRRLVFELPDDARSLTYRLSLAVSTFDRKLVDAVAEVPEAIASAREILDALAGPWIDRVADDEFRLSPLLGSIGQKQLTNDEQKAVHAAIARHMVRDGSIDASRLDQLILSALAGEADSALIAVVMATLQTSAEKLELLSRNAPSLTMLRTDQQLYLKRPRISVQLRMVQAVLLLAERKLEQFREALAAFESELAALAETEATEILSMTLGLKMLQLPGLPAAIPKFPSLIARTFELVEANDVISAQTQFDADEDDELGLLNLAPGQALLTMQMSNIPDLAVLEEAVSDLAALPSEARASIEPEADGTIYNHEQIVKSVWLKAKKRDDYSSEHYSRACLGLARAFEEMGEEEFALACHSNAAVILSEELSRHQDALHVLDIAEERIGVRYVLARSKASIHFLNGDHRRQLREVERLPFLTIRNGWVEGAYLMREIAIAHGHLGDWEKSSKFFEDAREQAECAEAPDMKFMAIGLQADRSVALWKGGRKIEALRTIDKALEDLEVVDPNDGFRQRALHRLVRFTGFWMYAEEKRLKERIEGVQADMVIGCCSNPNPHKGLDEMPHGSVMMIRYLLAELDIAHDYKAGIWERLKSMDAGVGILALECTLAIGALATGVKRRSVRAVAEFATKAVDAMVAIGTGKVKPDGSAIIPSERLSEASSEERETKRPEILQSVASFLTGCTLAGEYEKLEEFVQLDRQNSLPFLTRDNVKCLEEGLVNAIDPALSLLGAIGLLRKSLQSGDRPIVPSLFLTTLRILDVARFQPQPPAWVSQVGLWVAEQWTAAFRQERFRFSNPLLAEETVLPILAGKFDDVASIARLVLALEPYVGVSLQESHRESLRSSISPDV